MVPSNEWAIADEYWKAACNEIQTLEVNGAWDVVDRMDNLQVINLTWAFKLNCYQGGMVKKFKAHFCARGDQQLEGVNCFETQALGVQWKTVLLMLILEVILELKSKQSDITAAFLHTNVPEGENIYVEMPRGFKQKDKVFKLQKTLYGLQQSPRAFWQFLTEKMNECEMIQTSFELCLFVNNSAMCMCYVDDLNFWAKTKRDIDLVANKLIECGVLEGKDDAAGFLGARMTKDPKTRQLELKQTDLIDRVVETLEFEVCTAKSKFTPLECKLLVKDDNGESPSGNFSYSSVVRMMLYLSGHPRPDIAYAVNCTAWQMCCPKRLHEIALK